MNELNEPSEPAHATAKPGLWATLVHYASLVRFSHTIFGLPFTLASGVLAHRASLAGLGDGDGMTWLELVLIVVAFTGARTAAMGFNRIVDRRFDAANPRTRERELPAGKISLAAAWALTLLSAGMFVGASALLGPVALMFAPLCLIIIGGYSLFKRFSSGSHLVLGVALALGPAGAWVAVTGGLEGFLVPAIMMVAVATWVAGFDVIYSLQDAEFDRAAKLHSIPVALGVRGALIASALLHLITAAALVGLHWYAELGWPHLLGVIAVLAILLYEHWIVRPSDLSRIDKAFFDLNGWISIVYFAALLGDVLLR
ncbi:UbiA-like polyprenyltransferase [Nannocystaceae bacterium ST9]